MRHFLFFLACLISSSSLLAQAPEKMSYQAVIRDAGNNLLANANIGMRVSVLQNSTTGNAVYVETHTTTTNANGLVSLEIGTGTVVSGSFSTIDWGNGTYFIQTETDPTGGTSYSITGTNQLLSVPYALHAKTAESVSGGNDKVELLRLNFPASTSTTAGITGMARIKFNKEYFAHVDSITFMPFIRVYDSTNTAFVNLVDLTNNSVIATSSLQSNNIIVGQDVGFVESGNLYPYLPSSEITLGIRVRSGTAGKVALVGEAFLVIYRH